MSSAAGDPEASRSRRRQLGGDLAFLYCALIFAVGVTSAGIRVADWIEFAIGRLWSGSHLLVIFAFKTCALIAFVRASQHALKAYLRSCDPPPPEGIQPPIGWHDAGDVCEACGSEVWTEDEPEDESEEPPPIEADHDQPGDVR